MSLPLPPPADPAMRDRIVADLEDRAAAEPGSAHRALLDVHRADEGKRNLLDAVFGASPFLSGLILRDPGFALRCLGGPAGPIMDELTGALAGPPDAPEDHGDEDVLARRLRLTRSRAALLIALADIAGEWDLDQVTGALTALADASIATAVDWLLSEAHRAGKVMLPNPETPSEGCGYVVLAMGKQGAGELNYSSDVDLIVLYDADAGICAGGTEPATFFVRLTRRLVALLQDVTVDGHAFRADLRLRPDPRATQIAIAMEAAAIYYENMGQNWERAAMIKARPAAGDLALGKEFLDRLKPYVWRKYLDFAAIADVQSLKRQIHAVKGHGAIAVAGHNVKLGRGGIREIEFFVQTQQLIAGGRNPALRGRRTLDMLDALAKAKWIDAATARDMAEAYRFLRRIEHRIQMVADEQTHSLPAEPEALERFARFAGFVGTEAFSRRLVEVLTTVQDHYADLFEDAPELASEQGSLVFTGGEDDPETLETLKRFGFREPGEISATIRGWHFGRYNAVRSARAKELLTELMPQLLRALASAGDPDKAFFAFDQFLGKLPAGVQLLSMLKANPDLLNLIALVLGTAPRLSGILSRRPRVLDAVIDAGFFADEPGADQLQVQLREAIRPGMAFEEALEQARIIGSEQMFRIGLRLLSQAADGAVAARAYTELADALLGEMLDAALRDVAERHGTVESGRVCVVGMGKLGSGELTAGSDLDLILIYDHPDEVVSSTGGKAISPAQYYARVTQRLITALTAPTPEGTLYEVDMRLRPSGNKGPVATSLGAFRAYQQDQAWTWERMALTRARIVAGDPGLGEEIAEVRRAALTAPRDRDALIGDVLEMRRKIRDANPGTAVWDIKHHRGGLVDLEFIAQTLQLLHAPERPQVLHQGTAAAIEALAQAGCLGRADSDGLLAAYRIYHGVLHLIRLCLDAGFVPGEAPAGLERLVANGLGCPDIASAEALIGETQERVAGLFADLVGEI